MSLTFLPQKNILEKLVAFHPSSRTPHTLVPSHAACTLWTGPVTVTSRAAGVKKEGICSPSAMGIAPFRAVGYRRFRSRLVWRAALSHLSPRRPRSKNRTSRVLTDFG